MKASKATMVVIPAFNEAATIAAVVSSVRNHGYQVLVVDDGSSDDTGRRASSAGATVITHPENRGYDAALATGLRSATALAEVVVTLDADAQHDPAAIASLVDPILSGNADVVVGIRPAAARLAESLFVRHGRRAHGIPDPLCGMKAARSGLVAEHDQALTRASIGTGLVMACHRGGARITSVPVPVRERTGRSRFGAGLKAEWRIAVALLRCIRADLVSGPALSPPAGKARGGPRNPGVVRSATR